jgi:hypothetical protein
MTVKESVCHVCNLPAVLSFTYSVIHGFPSEYLFNFQKIVNILDFKATLCSI